jgi:ribosomal protein S18 acetylase RimI-like enzyme
MPNSDYHMITKTLCCIRESYGDCESKGQKDEDVVQQKNSNQQNMGRVMLDFADDILEFSKMYDRDFLNRAYGLSGIGQMPSRDILIEHMKPSARISRFRQKYEMKVCSAHQNQFACDVSDDRQTRLMLISAAPSSAVGSIADAGRNAGFIELAVVNSNCPKAHLPTSFGFILLMFVAPKFQGQGLAGLMLKELIEDIAVRLELQAVYVIASADVKNRRMYERAGFRQVEGEQVAAVDDGHVMLISRLDGDRFKNMGPKI